MQHHSGDKAQGTLETLPDPLQPNLAQVFWRIESDGNDTFTSTLGAMPTTNEVSPPFGGISPNSCRFPSGASLSVGSGYFGDLAPISPSDPFSRMGLSDKPISPVHSFSLEAVDEERGDEIEDCGVFLFDHRESMEDIFIIDDLALEGLPILDLGPLPSFDASYSPMEKDVIEDTKYSPPPSPGAVPRPRRRYTDGCKTDKAVWSPDYCSGSVTKDKFLGVSIPPAGYNHTGHYSSSYPTESGASSPNFSHTPMEVDGGSVHRTSSKRLRWHQRSSTRCSHCISPDQPKEGQRVFLHQLPVELLQLIFEFAYLSPIKFPKCEHKQKSDVLSESKLVRRATAGAILTPPPTNLPKDADPPKLSDSLRIYRAKTLLYIALTCRRFNDILLDPYIDNTFWRSAARWCWDWLPSDLADVQGRESSHQTSWRNLVGVFMRSENGLFKQKGGGKGGVESFGGSKGCTPAILWKDEKAKKFLESKQAEKRKLLIVCAQPGPDLFNVTYDGEEGKYTISLSPRGGVDYFITLDEYGRFGKKPARLPGGLKRSDRSVGYFPPDIFEVEGNRFQLVKVWKGRDRSVPAPSYIKLKSNHPKPAVKEVVTWDLHCVQEYDADPSATVARCTSRHGLLVFNLFTHRDRDSNIDILLDPPLDPPEDQRVFCVQALGYPGCHLSQKVDTNGKAPDETMSETRRGKMKATDSAPMDVDTNEPKTVFRWRREFEYERASDFEAARHLHYVICNMKLNSTKAVILIRWNIRTQASNEELVDRQFQILDLNSGSTIQVLQFPNLYWDHRHHDMSIEYNEMRHKKMSRLYNHMGHDEVMGAGNRCTRIHEDNFVLTDDKLVSGSHDYCNWVWDLNAKPIANETCVFNAERNDAGVADPFKVLDDFYWDEDQQSRAATSVKENWNTNNERAGWWVRTPNQVMCFWHGVTGSADGRYFAACRPGKMFLWDLEAKRNTVFGFENCKSSSNDSKNMRWLGRLAENAENLKHRLRNWFVWEDVIPEQGLWLLFDDFEAVYLDRDDILNASSLGDGKRVWIFQKDDFVFDNEDGRGRKQPEDMASDGDGDDSECFESDEESSGLHTVKRRRTNSLRTELFEEEGGFSFDNEKEMDEFGR